MSTNSIDEVHQFLDAMPTFKAQGREGANFSLERFSDFCKAIENPQNRFPSIHVAGSNGKGSTCQIIASMYQAAGYRVGVYTSPHILAYNERFIINGKSISNADLVNFFNAHEALIKSFRLTYFEISTALAFWLFARQHVDIALIETGLGGRLDSTNIITPLASVITTVSLDHTEILGNTIKAIAAEKGGIIKPEVPVVLGNVDEQAEKVLRQIADENRAEVFKSTNLNPDWQNGSYHLQIEGKPKKIHSTLLAPVQAYNIAAAWQVSLILQDYFPVTDAQRKEGIEKIGKGFPGRARFERLHPTYNWYFDGAHNIEAVQAMKKTAETIYPVSKAILVLSMMEDKINKKMGIEFLEFKKIIYHTLSLGRAATFTNVQQMLPQAEPFPVNKKTRNKLLNEFRSELVIFAGSFYFYATVQDWLSSFTIDR